MKKYEIFIKQSNYSFDDNDLVIGETLVNSCYGELCGFTFTKENLKLSKNYKEEEIYSNNSRTIKTFWDKLDSFNEAILDLYFKALFHYMNDF